MFGLGWYATDKELKDSIATNNWVLQKLCGILTKYNRKQGKQLRKQYTNINEAQIAAKIRLEVGVNDINSLSKCK